VDFRYIYRKISVIFPIYNYLKYRPPIHVMPPHPLSIDPQSKFFEGKMSVTVQIEDEDLAFIYETLVKLRDERKKEAQRIEKIIKQLEEAIKKREG